MGVAWYGECEACHRTALPLVPASGTPKGRERFNLFCADCHEAGRAYYCGPPEDLSVAGGWVVVAGAGVLGTLIGFLLAVAWQMVSR